MYAWGDEFAPKGRQMANTWQGEFRWQNLLLAKYERTSPIRSFPPNGYGLYEVAGNVWEWTTDYYTPKHPDEVIHACCGPSGPRLNPRVTSPHASYNLGGRDERFPRMVVKGGSHLCGPKLLRPLPTGSPHPRRPSRPRWVTLVFAASSSPRAPDEAATRVV